MTKKMISEGHAWYLILPLFDAAKIIITRAHFKKTIGWFCKDRGIKRSDIGIIAAARAELYFNGIWRSVSFDSIDELAKKGTDVFFTEKDGIPNDLTEWANKHGIAMVNTRGHLTEYGIDLMIAAKRLGANVVFMTDYDNSGIKIASESPSDIAWIGAKDEMLEYFKLPRESVSIAAEPKGVNKEPVKRLVQSGSHPETEFEPSRIDTRFVNVDVDFLEDERVELDSIIAKVGEQRFSEYIMEQLPETRNYNRAIDVPEVVESKEHDTFKKLLDAKVLECIEPERQKIIKEQSQVKGFIDVQEKKEDNKKRLTKVLTEIPEYNDLVNKLNELKSHPFFSVEVTDNQ